MKMRRHKNEVAIVDIETTGFLKEESSAIIEIGIVILNVISGEKRIVFDEMICESHLKRSDLERSWITENSDIDVEKVLASKSLEHHRARLQAIFDAYPSTAFNKQFDFDFLEDRLFKIPRQIACPMQLATKICRLSRLGQSTYKWPTVQEAYDHFFENNDYTEKHRGADDAYHEADIVYALFKCGQYNFHLGRPTHPLFKEKEMGLNKVMLIGNLGSDPEVRYTQNGDAVAHFNIATHEKWTDKKGQPQERTQWHKIVAWGRIAENCGSYLSKDRQVYIEGAIETEKWQDKDGRDRSRTKINATHVQFLSGEDGGRLQKPKVKSNPISQRMKERPDGFL